MISRILFESLWLLVITWTVVQFILIAVWSWRRSPRSARVVWAGFIALPLMIVVSSLLVTNRETLIAICTELGAAVERGDVRAIGSRLHEECYAEGLDREEFLRRAEQTLIRYRINDVQLRRFEVTFPEENVGIVEFTAIAHVRSADIPYEFFTSRWRLTFRKSADSWLAARIEALPSPQAGRPGLVDMLR